MYILNQEFYNRIKWGLWIIFLIHNFTVTAQPRNITDGPYIDIIKDSIRVRWIENGYPKDTILHEDNAQIFNRPGLPLVDLRRLNFVFDTIWEYNHVPEYIVLGDPHGKFDEIFNLLTKHKVTDSLGNWIFGDRHLVVIGDYFSRGDKVMEVLWFLFKLEQQAVEAHGKVHLILGNHDLMTMDYDLRYLNAKYNYTSGALKTRYSDFISP